MGYFKAHTGTVDQNSVVEFEDISWCRMPKVPGSRDRKQRGLAYKASVVLMFWRGPLPTPEKRVRVKRFDSFISSKKNCTISQLASLMQNHYRAYKQTPDVLKRFKAIATGSGILLILLQI